MIKYNKLQTLTQDLLSIQIVRFGIVGVLATLTHVSIVMSIVESHLATPLLANFIAFCLAITVSYSGHYKWTFKADKNHLACFSRFTVVALLSLGLNQGIMFLCINKLSWHYLAGLLVVVTTVPIVTFLVNRFWTFH